MAAPTDAAAAKVVSRNGTEIGVFSSGGGPPLVLVLGGLGDHTRWDALRPYLEPHVTVHAMDRRGRGASGDGPDYRLVLYEGWPPVDSAAWAAPPGFLEHLEELLATGDRQAVLATFLRECVRMSDHEIDAYRRQPSWQGRVAAAHTIVREDRAFQERAFDPEQAATITVPALLMVGEEQTLDWQAEKVEAALPDARICVLEGQAHTADIVAPELVAKQLLTFLSEQTGQPPRSTRIGA